MLGFFIAWDNKKIVASCEGQQMFLANPTLFFVAIYSVGKVMSQGNAKLRFVAQVFLLIRQEVYSFLLGRFNENL